MDEERTAGSVICQNNDPSLFYPLFRPVGEQNCCAERMKSFVSLLVLILCSLLAPVGAESILSVDSKAPLLLDCGVSRQRDFGKWDDAFVCKEHDMLVLRRGDTLYSLLMVEGAQPSKMATRAALAHTRIVACIPLGEKVWLLLNSTETDAFAIEANSAKVADFKIPNLTIPGSYAPRIQSYIPVPHADAVILMIEGGDRETWPRDGNRPVYFWMSLTTGNVVRFPIGWDLDYFSMDQGVAVFGKTQEEAFRRQAISMRTGESLESLPVGKANGYVPFNWTDIQAVKPIYMNRPKMGDQAFFKGLSVNGRALLIDLDFDKTFYLSQVMETDGFVGFRLRREGGSGGDPSPLWIVKAENPSSPERGAISVTDFAVIKAGNVVISMTGHGAKKASSEAFFRAFHDKSMWNVLDGVARLPELDRALAEKGFVQDQMTVRLITGFGNQSPIVLCLYEHFRGDMRSLVHPTEEKTVKSELWRRAVVVTSKGERCMTGLFREERVPDILWLHNSGILITGFTEAGKTQLTAFSLELPHASK